MAPHAFGKNGWVAIDNGDDGNIVMTVGQAERLQRQLGVAIMEAIGQMELVPRTHADELDRVRPDGPETDRGGLIGQEAP